MLHATSLSVLRGMLGNANTRAALVYGAAGIVGNFLVDQTSP
ncbi:hypothetical protein [Kibdelosporangium aridum]|nr:hypothetical protein [Kibdelosporangium aridum]